MHNVDVVGSCGRCRSKRKRRAYTCIRNSRILDNILYNHAKCIELLPALDNVKSVVERHH